MVAPNASIGIECELDMIGIDLVYIPEFEQQFMLGDATFLQKTFNVDELRNRRTEHLAGLWAAKEAVAKAASDPVRKWTDIAITHDKDGKPSARFGDDDYYISIAHHGDYAVAISYRAAA